jgi:hypothetical protein
VQIACTRVKLFAYLCQVLFTKQKEYERGSYSFFTFLSIADGFLGFLLRRAGKTFLGPPLCRRAVAVQVGFSAE